MKPVIIIAEAGVNHNGSYELACQMAVAAKEAGADIVKYQTAVPELVMSNKAPKAEYQKTTTGAEESQLEMAKKIHLPITDYKSLKEYCENTIGIKFLSTPFDHPSIEILHEIGMDCFKIPSGEITNKRFLERIGSFGLEVILSTGMSELAEIERAINTLVKSGTLFENITVLQCTSQYPCPYEDINLRAMQTIKNAFGCKVGLSDHSVGIEVSVAAVAMGACLIEKHFTLDKGMTGPDHLASLSPQELGQMVTSIRNIEKAMGDGVKTARNSEKPNILVGRKSIHAARSLSAGTIISFDDLIMKRPSNGISPYDEDIIIGKTLKMDVEADHQFQFEDFQID